MRGVCCSHQQQAAEASRHMGLGRWENDRCPFDLARSDWILKRRVSEEERFSYSLLNYCPVNRTGSPQGFKKKNDVVGKVFRLEEARKEVEDQKHSETCNSIEVQLN